MERTMVKINTDVEGAPYNAIDVAKYILAVAYKNGDVLTNLKLQKLLYYAQAWYMVHHDGKKLFNDDIEAWKYGPVVRSIYNKYKGYGNTAIDREASNEEDICRLTPLDGEFIDGFLAEFMECSAISLVKMIHMEDPWREAFDETNPKASNIISVDLMYRFYLDMSEKEILFEENEEEYYKKIIEERKNDPVIPMDKVLEMVNVGN